MVVTEDVNINHMLLFKKKNNEVICPSDDLIKAISPLLMRIKRRFSFVVVIGWLLIETMELSSFETNKNVFAPPL